MGLLIGRFIATQEVELEFDALADEVEDAASPIAARIAQWGRRRSEAGLIQRGPGQGTGTQKIWAKKSPDFSGLSRVGV